MAHVEGWLWVLPDGQKIRLKVGVQVMAEAIGLPRAEIGVDAANGEIHGSEFPGFKIQAGIVGRFFLCHRERSTRLRVLWGKTMVEFDESEAPNLDFACANGTS
jgi:hypothetical protein